MFGCLCVGSSDGNGLYIICDFEFVNSIISFAKSKIVRSDGLPKLTGPQRLEFIILIKPSTKSST